MEGMRGVWVMSKHNTKIQHIQICTVALDLNDVIDINDEGTQVTPYLMLDSLLQFNYYKIYVAYYTI